MVGALAPVAVLDSRRLWFGIGVVGASFGLGAAIPGISLGAGLTHELTSEHVGHELEVEPPTANAVHGC